MFRKIIVVGTPLLFLPACIGSQFIVDNPDTKATFPDLHDVPERPIIKKKAQEAFTKDQITQTHREDLRENQRLRQKYGL